jgi:hypothetical protein
LNVGVFLFGWMNNFTIRGCILKLMIKLQIARDELANLHLGITYSVVGISKISPVS